MVAPRRKSRKRKNDRREEAETAVEYLSRALESGLNSNSEISDSAARQILSIGKKHGSRPDSKVRRMICRTCRQSLVPGLTSRVRVSSKKIITTCLRCGRVSREVANIGDEEK
tara:strand:- start:1948 stop:2286 length:339 start_codon:yes stop_codon:yes gene_type:complete